MGQQRDWLDLCGLGYADGEVLPPPPCPRPAAPRAPALAAPCGGDFNAFLAAIARDAQGQGVSRAVIDRAFAGLTPDPAVLAFDRRQRGMFHAKSFEEYAATRVIPAASAAPGN